VADAYFRHCSTCKTPIAFGAKYFACSVSTCNRGPTALYFCSVACWDAHVPDARHRDAWAEEELAPSREELDSSAKEPRRRVVAAPQQRSEAPAPVEVEDDGEVLIVVSKLKGFIKASAAMSTSDGVMPVLSSHLRKLSVEAIRSASQNGRKTVLARDFEAALRGDVAKD
jgi:hypothetical protein